jgi:hypothetical protein
MDTKKSEGGLSFERIWKLALGFRASKCILSAVSLGVFTQLAAGPMDESSLRNATGINARGSRDFFDMLVALNILKRTGDMYENTPESAHFLDRAKPTYIGGFLEMCDSRLYGFWGSLNDALLTGKAQSEVGKKDSENELFSSIYSSPEKLQRFLRAMTGLSIATGRALAREFPWEQVSSFVDVGAAQGAVAVQLAHIHPHLRGVGMDLPAVEPVFQSYVDEHGLSDRLQFLARDFFKSPLPSADVIVMGQILHDWGMQTRRMLLKKAFDALPDRGSLIVYETLIDDEREKADAGLLMSINMLIMTPEGGNFTGRDCRQWMMDAGFSRTSVHHLTGPDWMVVGTKG